MEINTALFTYLSGYAGLTALVGKRIYPDSLPQSSKYPAISYQQVSETEVDTFNQPATIIGPIYQFNCWADTRAEAKAVAKQLRLAFKNLVGVIGGGGGVTIAGVEKINQLDNIEKDADGQVITYNTIADYQIWYQE